MVGPFGDGFRVEVEGHRKPFSLLVLGLSRPRPRLLRRYRPIVEMIEFYIVKDWPRFDIPNFSPSLINN